MEPSGLSSVRRGHPQRPRYRQTLVQNGDLWAVSRQARVPTETSVRTDTCTEWSPPGCQPSAEGTHSDLLRTDTCTLVQNGVLQVVRRGHPQRPRYGQTLVQNGALRAVSLQARAPTETPEWTVTYTERSPPGCQARATQTPVRTDTCTECSCQPSGEGTHRDPLRTDTCTEWSPPGCQPSGEDTHRDPGTDRHLYTMEPSRLSAVRRGNPQRPRYGQTLVQNGALRAVSRQMRAPTETPVRTDTCTEWSPPGCQPSDEGTHRGPRYGLSGEGTHRGPGTDRHLYRMDPSGLSAVRRGLQRTRYGQALVQNGALRAVSRQARVPTESPVRTDTWTEWSPLGCSRQSWAPTETLVRTDTCTEWSRPGCRPSGEGTHRDPSTDRHLYRMEPSGLSAVGRVLQRPRYRQTLLQKGALRAVSCQMRAPTETLVWAVSRQVRAPTETPVRTDTCTEWSPPGCEPSSEGTHRDPSTDRHLYRMEPSGLSAVR
ncbi:hypothetical protein NDU88_006632 [Pleurodeles waltl]|uniref:Uncharacterized protein n=1 Tax=Pleurodeles waltl TaxID=8319 RepID=A0AAV7L4C9_PLEWA|nr:hypothetical protein NDU88_006632 [Pleurodeles waltl]